MRKIKFMLPLALLLSAGALGGCTKYNIIETGIAEGKHNTNMLTYLKEHKANQYELLLSLIEHAGMQATFEGVNANDPITFFAPTDYSIRRYLYEYIGKLRERHSNLLSEQDGLNAEIESLRAQIESASSDEEKAPLMDELEQKEASRADLTARIEAIAPEVAKYEQYKETDYSIKDMSIEQCQQFLKALIIPGKRLMVADVKRGKQIVEGEGIEGGEKFRTMNESELWLYAFQESYANVPNAGPVMLNVRSAADTNAVIFVVESSDIQTLSGIVHTLPSQRYTLGDIQ